LKIQRVTDFELDQELKTKLQKLLSASFPGFLDTRIYYKQLPNFRLICWEGETIIAQTGVVHRVISLDGLPTVVFGVVDLCVEESHRSKAIGTSLLREIELLAKKFNIDFIILFADDQRLYLANGFVLRTIDCTWLKMDEHKTHGIGQEKIDDSFHCN